jgi:hypothetical protein
VKALAANKNRDVIIQIYGSDSTPKRIHECNLCKIYRYEISKGNKDAYACYLNHLNYLVKKQSGLSIKLSVEEEELLRKRKMPLPIT